MNDRLLDVELGRLVRIEFVCEKLCNGSTVLVTLGPLLFGNDRYRRVGLRVEIDEKYMLAIFLREDLGNRYGGCRLSDTTFEINEAQNVGLYTLEVFDPRLDAFSPPDWTAL